MFKVTKESVEWVATQFTGRPIVLSYIAVASLTYRG